MVAKILLCVALCFTFNQVSLAGTDEAYFRYDHAVKLTTAEPSSCQESLRNVRNHLQQLFILYGNLRGEIQQALEKGYQCLQGQVDVLKCIQDTVKESTKNVEAIVSQFNTLIQKLVQSVTDAINNCIFRRYFNLIRDLSYLGLEYLH